MYAADGTVTKLPLYYDNYFVPARVRLRRRRPAPAPTAPPAARTSAAPGGAGRQGGDRLAERPGRLGQSGERDRGHRDRLDHRQGRHDRQVLGRHGRQRRSPPPASRAWRPSCRSRRSPAGTTTTGSTALREPEGLRPSPARRRSATHPPRGTCTAVQSAEQRTTPRAPATTTRSGPPATTSPGARRYGPASSSCTA